MSLDFSRRTLLGGLASVLLVRAAPDLALPDHAIRVDAAHQQGGILTLHPLTEPLLLGDVIEIEGVEAYNARLGGAQKRLRQFVVTKKSVPGERILCLYPYLVPRENHYATVCKLPARGARVLKVSTPQGFWRVQGTGDVITYTRLV